MNKRTWLIGAVVAVVAAAILVPVAIAATVTTTVSGTAITSIKMVRSDQVDASIHQGGEPGSTRPWVDLPGASTTMTIPSRTKAAFLVTFSEQHRCTGSIDAGADYGGGFGCVLRVLVNEVSASPASFEVGVGDLGPGEYLQLEDAVTSQFSTNVLPAGNYTIQVQYSTAGGSTRTPIEMIVRKFHLTVERVKA